MIDTIRFKIPITDELKTIIQKRSIETKKTDLKTDKVELCFYRSEPFLGSYDYRINFILSNILDNEIFLEFSIPKFHYGHNIYLVYPQNLEEILQQLYTMLYIRLGVFPTINEWQIERLDVCYAWKYPNSDISNSTIQSLKFFDYPRQKKQSYDTSIMHVGNDYSIKFYNKYEEFYTHDFKKIRKIDNDLAYELLQASNGVLRFEATLRKKFLKYYLLKEYIYYSDLTLGFVSSILNQFLYKYTKGLDLTKMNSKDAYDILKTRHKPQKAYALYQFWLMYFTSPTTKQILIEKNNRSTIYRNLKAIKDAHIGVPTDALDMPFPLSIPSDRVVNNFTLSKFHILTLPPV